jgi:hypothetical protein
MLTSSLAVLTVYIMYSIGTFVSQTLVVNRHLFHWLSKPYRNKYFS